jgi:type II secretory pathway pseudopilin PulG
MKKRNTNNSSAAGFTIPEVIIAGVILIIICVGTAQTFIVATRYNRGNNLRMQALSVLQKNVEYYRSLKFVPVGTSAQLNEGTHALGNQQSGDGQWFTVTATVVNLPAGTLDGAATLKEITIEAYPQVAETEGWLTNASLNTRVTVQRVRGN